MDIQHPDIDRIERTGYPDAEYLAWELQQQEEAEEAEEADELWIVEWRERKNAHPAKVNA